MSAPIPTDLVEIYRMCVDDKRALDFDNSVAAVLIERIAALEAQVKAITKSRDMHACNAVDLFAQVRQLREALEELLFWIYPTEGDDLRKHDQFTDCAMDCYRLMGHDRAPEFFRVALAATEKKP